MSRLKILAATLAIALVGGGAPAYASCYQHASAPADAKLPPLPSMPMGMTAATATPTIVGLWKTVHSSQGQVFFESLDMWHSDGTEFEFGNFAPATGDICLGVWTQSTKTTVKLFHTGYTFDNDGNLTGTLILTATDTVTADNKKFSGTFSATFYDLKHKLVQTVTGTTTATRINPPNA